MSFSTQSNRVATTTLVKPKLILPDIPKDVEYYNVIADEIKRRMAMFIEGHLPAAVIDNSHKIIYAGGAISDIYHTGHISNDIDAFITETDEYERLKTIFKPHNMITTANDLYFSHPTQVVSRDFGSRFQIKTSWCKADFIHLNNKNTPQDILQTFDFVNAMVGFEYSTNPLNMKIHASRLSLWALEKKLLIINDNRTSFWNPNILAERVSKYIDNKGYKFAGHSKDFHTI